MKKPEYTLSYDRYVPVFRCFVAAFYSADALILLTSLFCRRSLYRRYLYYIHMLTCECPRQNGMFIRTKTILFK